MIIKRAALKAAMACASAEDSRYMLVGAHVRPNGTVEGTDGHLAVRITDHEPYPDGDFPDVPGADTVQTLTAPIVVPIVAGKRLIANMPKRSTMPVLTAIRFGANGHGPVGIVTDLERADIVPVQSVGDDVDQVRYPDLDRVMVAADKPDTIPVILGVEVLEKLCKAAKAVREGDKRPVFVRFDIPTAAADRFDKGAGPVSSAFRFTATGSDGLALEGVVMPARP